LIESNSKLFEKGEGGEVEKINPGLVALEGWYKIIHFMAGEDLTKYQAIEKESVSKVVFNLNERRISAEKRQREIERSKRRAK
jgi:hypothetical protein